VTVPARVPVVDPGALDGLADECVRDGEPTWVGQRGVVVADPADRVARLEVDAN
jgi:hypothetical protein